MIPTSSICKVAYLYLSTMANNCDALSYRQTNPLFVFKQRSSSKLNTTRKQLHDSVSGACKPLSKLNHKSHFNIPSESSKIGISKGDMNLQDREARVKVCKENVIPDEVDDTSAMTTFGELIQEGHTIQIALCENIGR